MSNGALNSSGMGWVLSGMIRDQIFGQRWRICWRREWQASLLGIVRMDGVE
jgi:hypothetical protein